MGISGKFSVPLLLLVCSVALSMGQGFPKGRRLYRSLPSVSDDHYSELRADGTYNAERRLRDGTVEGETLYVRQDGVPVKVHYFADSHGYRPKTEVLYAERLAAARKVIVPDVVYDSRAPGVVLAPPVLRTANNLEVRSAGDDLAVGNNNGGDTAFAQPSVTAIVGPGGHVNIAPEAVARTGNSYSRNLRTGDTAIAKPSVNAVVGPGASVSISPKATALTGSAGIGDHPIVYERELRRPVTTVVREVHQPITQIVKEVQPVTYVKEVPVVREIVRPVAVPVVREIVRPVAVPVPVATASRGYVYAPPTPELTAVRAQGVVVVPPNPSYSYEYAYSAPDEKHPGYGNNRAYVNVKVNQ
ncbi:unnamed protein product [Allacma fusca]|uniref:Cuticle protein n=1 Tax=Allacma fusca TaxID=39272 RepID=A0A8J2LRS3_9HEXA|nr:unnamed protein product [Allacma fusca]